MARQQILPSFLIISLLVITFNNVDAGLKGSENWKQRYREWRDSEEPQNSPVAGTADAKQQEENNSVWDSPSEKELFQKSITIGKQQRKDAGNQGGKPLSEITAWHNEKHRRKFEERLKEDGYNPQSERRRQPREYRLEQHVRERSVSVPPPHEKFAEMARYIVHNSNWGALAYTSRHPGSNGRPMADILSISDGSGGNSTGIPYMYVTPKDIGIQDLAKDNHCSLAMTLAQGDYCRTEGLDPEDPRCAHVYLNGKLKTLKNGTAEWNLAKKYFFDRHPHLKNLPADHKFRFAKLKISQVIVQDYFGGPGYPTLEEYFAAKPEVSKNRFSSQDEAAEVLPVIPSALAQSAPIP